MSVTNKFNLVLSNKVANNTYNTTTTPNYLRKFANQTDSFESSTKKNQISFKGAQKIPAEIQKMISSNNYWKILGATIATTATALWAKITNNGQNDADLTIEEIENKIRENLPEIFQEQEAEATETTEEVIDIEAKKINEEAKENTTLTLEENKPSEAPKKRRGRPPKNLKLEGGQQPDTSKAVPAKRRQQAGDVELIKTLAEQGLTVSEIEAETGIKVQQIKRIAKKENITLVDGRKKVKKADGIRDAKEVEEVKEEEVKKPLAEESELEGSVKQQKTPITDEIIDKTIKLSEQKISQQEIAKILGISPASVCRILSGELLLGKSAPVKELRETFEKEINDLISLCKYTPEIFFEKYTAKSYRLYLKQLGEDKLLDFAITKKNSPMLMQDGAIKNLLEAQNEVVPKNDSIYEDYKNCFNKKQFISKFLELRKEYVINLLNEITQKEQYYKFKLLNNAENITAVELLDLLCKAKISKVLEKQDLAYSEYLQESSETNSEKDMQESAKQDLTNSTVKDNVSTLSSKPEVPVVKNISELGKDGYIKFLNEEISCDEPLKNIVLQRYKNYLDGNEEISIEEAVECLKKVDEYLDLTEEEKCRIDKISEIFDYKNSKLEKKILEKIIDIEYMTKDTKIYNSYYGKDVIITTKAKEEIKNNKQSDYINILKSFESASALHSRKKNDPGVREYFNDYSMEIRLAGNFGAMRLYSSKLCKDKNGNEIKNFIFDHFASDH